MTHSFFTKPQKKELLNRLEAAINQGATFEESLEGVFNFFSKLLPLNSIHITSRNRRVN